MACLHAGVCVCQRERVCLGANECVSSCGPVHRAALIGCEERMSKRARSARSHGETRDKTYKCVEKSPT